jgi:hypothetical protein
VYYILASTSADLFANLQTKQKKLYNWTSHKTKPIIQRFFFLLFIHILLKFSRLIIVISPVNLDNLTVSADQLARLPDLITPHSQANLKSHPVRRENQQANTRVSRTTNRFKG